MAVKIRLRRTGARNDPCFRVVAADAASPRDGRFIEVLGWYDPKIEGKNFELKSDRIDHWVSQGAIVTTAVKSIMKRGRQAEKAESA